MSPYFYDAILLIILLCAIGTGYKRGVLHTLLNIVCLVVAFTVASVMSAQEVTTMVYDEYLHSTVMGITEDAVNSAKQKAKETLQHNINEFALSMIDEHFDGNEVMKEYALRIIEDAEGTVGKRLTELCSYLGYDQSELLTNPVISGKIDKIVKEYSDNIAIEINRRLPLGITVRQGDVEVILTDKKAHEAIFYELMGNQVEDGVAEYIESVIIRPVILRFMGILIWSISFTAVNFILHIIIRIILLVRKIEPIKACDSLLGALLGAVGGIAVTIVCTSIIVLLVNATGGMTYMNEDYFTDTIIFGKIYNMISAVILSV